MKQHKKCNGCKAFSFDKKCDLGYNTKPVYFNNYIVIDMIPLEPCEKPTSTNKFAEILILNTKTNANTI